jgi:hypothetical protein
MMSDLPRGKVRAAIDLAVIRMDLRSLGKHWGSRELLPGGSWWQRHKAEITQKPAKIKGRDASRQIVAGVQR